jgi:hypothetical protein
MVNPGVSQVNPLVSFAVIGIFTIEMIVPGAFLFKKIRL